MENIDRLNAHLQAGQFQEAVTLALTNILPGQRSEEAEAAWDELKRLEYSTTRDNFAVQGCPFLLGCLQVVEKEDTTTLEGWRQSLEADSVTSLLRRGELPPHYYDNAQAALACGEAAIAARRNDFTALLEQGYRAAQWFAGTPSPQTSDQVRSFDRISSFLDKNLVESCFAALAEAHNRSVVTQAHRNDTAEGRQLLVGRARNLTRWFLSPTQSREMLRTAQKIMVPLYLRNKGAVATLEMELLPGRGELYADPVAMAFVQCDSLFKASCENAHTYLNTLGWWRNDADVCWRIQSTPPLSSLTKGSAGGAFFSNLWHLLAGIRNDVSVTVSACIDADGRVSPVEHIEQKIHAILEVPELSELVVAADQNKVTNEVITEQYGRLRIRKATHLADPKRHGHHPEGNR
jgi:hypothetical protein